MTAVSARVVPGTRRRVVLATRNQHKVIELRAILAASDPRLDVEALVGLDEEAPDVVESGVTFEQNALLKARNAAAFTGLPALADDSGLCVDVLGGAPGVFSARWVGRHGDDAANLRLLLDQLVDVPENHRGAHFACAAALVTPQGHEVVEVGRLMGQLTTEPSGIGGFGYDPVLRPVGHDVTCAQLTPEQKNDISHRGQAFRALVTHLTPVLANT